MRANEKATAEAIHPNFAVLRRFVRGEVTKAERKEVIAHLLRRCGSCADKLRRAAWLP